jgi:hypothetical protein
MTPARLLIALLLVLAGCASTTRWTRPDRPPEGSPERAAYLEQFRRDDWECTRDSRTIGGGAGVAGIAAMVEARGQARRLYAQCMEAKGWQRAP